LSNHLRGIVLDIQRMSTEDGPGLRTTVFFKGCTLKCKWCHNPESISFSETVFWHKHKCIGCLDCVKGCPNGAISMLERGIYIDRKKCKSSFFCAKNCPSGALELKGKSYQADELFAELIKDRAYFTGGGGVTLSGGEVLAQAEFAAELLKKLRDAGVDTAVDTAGFVPYTAIEKVLPYTTHLLYDLKIIDSGEHKRHTGAGNELILENLKKAVAEGAKIWIRTPVIPDATDSEENILGISRFISEELGEQVEKWELCAFNNLCKNKYEMLDKEWEYDSAGLISKDKMNALWETAKSLLKNKDLVKMTGATAQT